MITCKDVSFRYQSAPDTPVLSHVNLTVPDGQVVLLCGRSGCGKTTLTRILNGLVPHYYEGQLSGVAELDGVPIAETPLYTLAEQVGSVFQNPRSQFFNVDTTSELAFACENMGMPEAEIRRRLDDVVQRMGLQDLTGRSIFHLSGGEKQKIACGGVSMLSPRYIILDEPTSNLDVPGIHMLRQVLADWKRQGKTIVIAEHRLWFLEGLADRVVYLQDGAIAEEYPAADFFARDDAFFQAHGLRSVHNRCPQLPQTQPDGDVLTLINLYYRYPHSSRPVLDLPRLTLPMGEAVALVGPNGAGKSTLVQCLCGLLKGDRSSLTVRGIHYPPKKRLPLTFLVMQDVSHQLFTESVLDEVLLSMENEDETQARRYLDAMDLLPYQDCHPMALSGGQKQRLALAAALASGREILIFDEPTSGLDLHHMQRVAESIRYLKAQGRTILIVTHDAELISACCDRIVALKDGRTALYDESFFA